MISNVNVFFAISKSFIPHFTAALTSLLENNKDITFNVFVIHDAEDVTVFNTVDSFFKTQYATELNFLNIGSIDFSKFRTTGHYPKYTYFRLFLADIAPSNVDQALFLDSDIIVTGSIEKLANLKLNDQYIAAVSEVSVADNVERLNAIGFANKSYFNAGIILVNIKKWRDERLSEKFIDIATRHADKLEWVDQDILNIYFANNWIELDKKFNATHLTKKLEIMPVIVHYASYSKPWFYVDTHPYNSLYWKYLSKTPFKGTRAVGFSLKNFILKNGRLFKRKLREAGLLND